MAHSVCATAGAVTRTAPPGTHGAEPRAESTSKPVDAVFGHYEVENHAAVVALYFMYYNFGRVHQTLRVTPAMESGVSDHIWSIAEIVALLDKAE